MASVANANNKQSIIGVDANTVIVKATIRAVNRSLLCFLECLLFT